jgi:selenocysteine lyase/cysteine desulfurase
MEQFASTIRNDIPFLETRMYLDNAHFAPPSGRIRSAVQNTMEALTKDPGSYDHLLKNVEERCHQAVSRLLGCRQSEVTLGSSTSDCLNCIVESVKFEKGDHVLTTDLEFPSGVLALELARNRYGVEIDILRSGDGNIPLEDFSEAISKKTKLVLVSHVSYLNGTRLDIGEIGKIAHESGAFLVVDAAQSLGAVPINVDEMNIDFLASTAFKWQLGIPGVAPFFISASVIDDLRPAHIGWRGLKCEGDAPWFPDGQFEYQTYAKDGAARFDLGNTSILSVGAMAEAMGMIADIGIERISSRLERLTGLFYEDPPCPITTPEDSRAGIVLLNPDDQETVEARLKRAKVIVSKRGGIRVSPGVYNTEDEITGLTKIVKELG